MSEVEDLSTQITSQITWRNIDDKWLLFVNNDYKPPKSQKDPKDKKRNLDVPFYFGSKKKESKGTIVHTPQGYGIIQELKRENQEVIVKLHKSNKIIGFQVNEISSDIPLLITMFSGNLKLVESLILPIASSSSDLISKIESAISEKDENVSTVQVYYKGKEIINTESNTLDKLDISPFTKLLAISQLGKPYHVERYTNVYEGWGYSDRSINAIAFSVNKDIKIKGFGIYVADNSYGEQRTFITIAKFLKGIDNSGQVLHNKEMTVNESNNGTKIFQYSFERPIRIKGGEVYSCVQESIGTYNCYTYYGDSGKTTVEGEKDIVFTFIDCFSSSNNTNRSCGQIPEIYYYA